MEKVMNALVALLAVALMGFGIYSVVSVGELGAMTGLSTEGAMGLSEMRAIYGAFLIQGLFLIYALMNRSVRATILMVIGITWAGYIAMRVISIALDGFDPAMTAAMGSEAVVAVILIAAARLASKPVSSKSILR